MVSAVYVTIYYFNVYILYLSVSRVTVYSPSYSDCHISSISVFIRIRICLVCIVLFCLLLSIFGSLFSFWFW